MRAPPHGENLSISVVRDDSIWAQGVSADTNPYSKRGAMVRFAYFLVACVAAVLGRLGVRRPSTVVICYHAITNKQRARFAWQMDQVARLGALSAEHVGSVGAVGVCVTFDDAFDCLRENAFPVMRALGIPATVFAVSGNLGSPPRWSMPPGHPEASLATMSDAAIVALRSDPLISFGSHTVTHPPLAEIEPARTEAELFASRRDLEALTGCPVELLALPHGSVSPFVVDAARRAGYRAVFTLEPEIVRGVPESGLVGRFSVSPDMWMSEFRLTIAGAYAWLGPWRRFVRWLRARFFWRKSRGRSAARALST